MSHRFSATKVFIILTVSAIILASAFIAGYLVRDQGATSRLEEANQEIAQLEQEKATANEQIRRYGIGIDVLAKQYASLGATNTELEATIKELRLENRDLESSAKTDADVISLLYDRMDARSDQINAEHAPVTGDNSSPWERDQMFREAMNTQDYETAYEMVVSAFREYCTLETFSELMSENDVTMGKITFLGQAVEKNNMFAAFKYTTGFVWSNRYSIFPNENGQWMIPLDPRICAPPPPQTIDPDQ